MLDPTMWHFIRSGFRPAKFADKDEESNDSDNDLCNVNACEVEKKTKHAWKKCGIVKKKKMSEFLLNDLLEEHGDYAIVAIKNCL